MGYAIMAIDMGYAIRSVGNVFHIYRTNSLDVEGEVPACRTRLPDVFTYIPTAGALANSLPCRMCLGEFPLHNSGKYVIQVLSGDIRGVMEVSYTIDITSYTLVSPPSVRPAKVRLERLENGTMEITSSITSFPIGKGSASGVAIVQGIWSMGE